MNTIKFSVSHENRGKEYPWQKLRKTAYFSIFFGLTLWVLVSFVVDRAYYSFIGIALVFFLFIYFYFFGGKKSLSTNMITSFIKAFCFLTVWWMDTPVGLNESEWNLFFKIQLLVVFYVSIGFIATIVNSLLMDIINIDKDYRLNHKTIPILFGRKRVKSIIFFISIIGCLAVLSLAILFSSNKYIFTTVFLTGILPELYFIYHLLAANSNSDYQKLLKKSYVAYALAIFSVPIIAYYFKNVV
ncbi:hypothetical protein [Tenacibaculum sp. SG-28]|uniref:hypothetical protein n=1 Tax=Tenacibaculum sp. SG-28 TaxID=754426 RepID=UPI0011B076A5|nr:hypothetical protein [Tenacibaculum sp. SG-28]